MKFGDTIYYCKKVKGIENFDKPIPITLKMNHFSLQPSKAVMDILVYGKDVDKIYIAYAPIKEWGANYFKEFDRFYIDYAKPTDDEEYGEKANAEIQSVSYQNLFIKLVIRKIVLNQEEEY